MLLSSFLHDGIVIVRKTMKRIIEVRRICIEVYNLNNQIFNCQNKFYAKFKVCIKKKNKKSTVKFHNSSLNNQEI